MPLIDIRGIDAAFNRYNEKRYEAVRRTHDYKYRLSVSRCACICTRARSRISRWHFICVTIREDMIYHQDARLICDALLKCARKYQKSLFWFEWWPLRSLILRSWICFKISIIGWNSVFHKFFNSIITLLNISSKCCSTCTIIYWNLDWLIFILFSIFYLYTCNLWLNINVPFWSKKMSKIE